MSDDNVPSSHESQDEEDLLGAIRVARPYRFELSDSVSEVERSLAAMSNTSNNNRQCYCTGEFMQNQ